MGDDSGGGADGRNAFVDADDWALEPEIVRWLSMYVEAGDHPGDATVAAIFDEVNRLLRRYRKGDLFHLADDESRLQTLTEHLPLLLRTTDTMLRVTTISGGDQAAVDIDPSGSASLSLTAVVGTGSPGSSDVDAHQRALHGQRAVFEYDRRSPSSLAHVQPLSDPAGVIVGTIGLAIDFTERKRTEEA